MPEVQVVVDPRASLDALKEIVTWAESLDLAYAWASSASGSATHWKLLPLKRVRRAILGIHFAQTEPRVLRELRDLGVLRVIPDTGGVFHPKLIIGVNGREARALVGSSNLTPGGFSGNTEVNIFLAGPVNDPALRQIADFMENQWTHPRAFEPDEKWFEDYERLYENRPDPPKLGARKRGPRTVVEAMDLEIAWTDFVVLISCQERRALWTGLEIHVFDHPESSYLQEVETCQAAFAAEPSYANMPEDDRKLIAGWGERTAGYYGRMKGAGYFKNLTRERPAEIGKHLDRIPLAGAVAIDETRTYLNGIMGVKGVALGTATRLLCMKRPDIFLPANRASVANIKRVFGTAPNTVEKYLALVQRIWRFPWFSAPVPNDEAEARIWRARVALLDAIFYEPA
jgi:hypothetical protein